ncbi:MAG: hypothetical protein M1818_006991 [Claussenomyces sp. TS43310]|nr:MAG: hypothetical protein M1818_006991 [Claussenomyces sp. TS43310]
MDSNGLRRKDTTKGPPLRILSLDGGGVRGYSMLIIIQELMHRTYVEIEGRAPRRDQIPKPCDHFDLICGTGTGGLIAIMLGRLRLDLETCKEVYVRMTRKVFETDKTIAGIPYRSTLFKASKLEEAIKECVREHTIYEEEGNDGPLIEASSPMTPMTPMTPAGVRRHASNASVVSFSNRSPTSYNSRFVVPPRWGNPNAFLYDSRENRTKTFVTAVYKGTPKGGLPALLRSYDSRKEPAPEFNCTIWQAGRATSATGLAFKPIQIGQSVFIDEGAGLFNPGPVCLDEATMNEWPGREVGVFVSIGTGKRPSGSDHNKHLWYEDFMGEFAEARKRLIAKIEGCEDTHQFMAKNYLAKRGVNPENYYRLNVEIGVGEFGMNEWNRLADISTGTRRYLAKPDVQGMNLDASAKLARIHRAKARLDGRDVRHDLVDIPEPFAVELPAEVPLAPQRAAAPARPSYEQGQDALAVATPSRSSPRTSDDSRRHGGGGSGGLGPAPTTSSSSLASDDRFVTNAPTPSQFRTAVGADKIAIMSLDEYPKPQDPPAVPQPQSYARPQEPPPLPPKTPISFAAGGPRTGRRQQLPYPLDDGPPPTANMARKPDFKGH